MYLYVWRIGTLLVLLTHKQNFVSLRSWLCFCVPLCGRMILVQHAFKHNTETLLTTDEADENDTVEDNINKCWFQGGDMRTIVVFHWGIHYSGLKFKCFSVWSPAPQPDKRPKYCSCFFNKHIHSPENSICSCSGQNDTLYLCWGSCSCTPLFVEEYYVSQVLNSTVLISFICIIAVSGKMDRQWKEETVALQQPLCIRHTTTDCQTAV